MGLLEFIKRLIPFGASADSESVELAAKFNSVFNYEFKDESLLFEALIHRSYLRTEDGEGLESYERLEFLGDSVLGLIVAEALYLRFPDSTEGELTKLKSLLVNETSLSRIGGEAGLGEFVRLSSDEERAGGRKRSSILADCFEAVLGAIYLDGSIAPVRKVVERLILSRISEIRADKSQINYKGQLLEFLQARGLGSPSYDVLAEEGPDHRKVFKVGITFQNELIGAGEGTTKKEAEQKAAMQALGAIKSRYGSETRSSQPS